MWRMSQIQSLAHDHMETRSLLFQGMHITGVDATLTTAAIVTLPSNQSHIRFPLIL